MRSRTTIKVSIDIAMTLILFVVMAYHKTGESLHKWVGTGMFVLFILHHVINRNWYKTLTKGKYPPARIFQLSINILLLLDMLALMLSGFLLSSLAFRLHIQAGIFPRKMHMLSASWGYVLMAAHLGFHWKMVAGRHRRTERKKIYPWLSGFLMAAVTIYGMYAAAIRQFFLKMFWLVDYAFYDFGEPVICFVVDYTCIFAGFASLSYWAMNRLTRKDKI